MNRARRESESRFLEQVALYREEYRRRHVAEVHEERERRHASGEVYFAGCYVPRAEVGRVAQGLQRHEFLAFFEILVLVVILGGIASGLWQLFVFLLLP
jgi:hypothetical protein